MAPLRIPQENGEWLNIDDEIERVAGGGGSGGLQSAPISLDNAQIIALPTTAVQVVATPGANKMHVIVSAVMFIDATGGAYGGFDDMQLFLNYGATLKQASSAYHETDNGAFADDSTVHVLGVFEGSGSGSGAAAWIADVSEAADKPLTVFMANGANPTLTDGDAADTLTGILYYLTIDTP